jgi:hypothetical protein
MSGPRVIASTGACLLFSALALVACNQERRGSQTGVATSPPALPQRDERVKLDPSELTTEIDNAYWPMIPGDRRVYRITDPEGTTQRAVATVTGDTKRIANGVRARVAHTAVFEGGELVEDNHAWYSQDVEGNVWYLGERAREYDNGKLISSGGSWQAGVDGAKPGVIMPARPEVGLAYREEHAPRVAEDRAEVVSLDERAEVPFGRFRDVVMIKETEGIERALLDFKFYAPDVGPVLGIEVSAGSGREELVSFRRGSVR